MRRIGCAVLVVVLACGLAACGDDGDSDDEGDGRPERTALGAEDFGRLCDAVTAYAMATVPAGGGTGGAAYDSLKDLVLVVSEAIDSSDRTEESGRVIRQCQDELTNVLQAAG